MRDYLRRMPLGARLVAAFLVLGLAPLVAVGVVAYRSAQASHARDAGRSLEEVAYNAIDKLDRNLFERHGDVQAFALSDPARIIACWRPPSRRTAPPSPISR